MLGTGNVPATGVTAVLVDIAPVSPTANTWLSAWEDGTPRPSTSNINVRANSSIISNTAIVPVSPAGKIAIYNAAGNVHVAIDVQGYFTSVPGSSGQGGFVPTAHTQLVNTTSGIGAPKQTIPAGGSLTVQVTGAVVPAGANAAFFETVVMSATAAGWLAAYPAGGSAGQSVFDYGAGITGSGLAVKLGTDGKVVFVNRGTSAINFALHLQGYFAADPAKGAGYRKVVSRLAGDVVLAANSTVDIAVGGRFGVPTKAVAGAAINFTTVSQSQAGYLRAWPVGDTEPTTSLANFTAGVQRASQAIIKPGAEGKIRVKNVSSGTVTLYADLQGWFADPLPVLAVQRYSPAVIFQPSPAPDATVAPLEYAYVNNLGQLMHGHQPDLDRFNSVQWTPISGSEAFTGRPSLGQGADGKLLIAAQNIDSGTWSRSSVAPVKDVPVDWSDWTSTGGVMASPPVIAKLPDGSAVQFAVDEDRKLWQYRTVNGEQQWGSLGDAGLAGTPTVVTIRDGVQLVGVDLDGGVRTAVYRAGALSAWTSLGGAGFTGSPAVVVNPGYRLRVFVRSADGTIMTKQQNEAGVFPAEWDPTGGFVAAGSPAALISPVTGRIQIVARGTDDEIHWTQETAQASGAWLPWDLIRNHANETGPNPDPSATDPSIIAYTNVNGSGFAVVFRNVNNVFRAYTMFQRSGLAKVEGFAVHEVVPPGP